MRYADNLLSFKFFLLEVTWKISECEDQGYVPPLFNQNNPSFMMPGSDAAD